MNDQMNIRINSDTKRKAIMICKAKGINLSEEVRKMVEKYAKEYDKKNSK